MPAKLEVKLEPHIGIQNTPLGPMEVDLGQYLVMAQTEHTDYKWVHLGYICKPCPTNLTPPFNGLDNFRVLPQSLKDEIVRRVAELMQTGIPRATEVAEPIVIPEDYEDDYEDDDA